MGKAAKDCWGGRKGVETVKRAGKPTPKVPRGVTKCVSKGKLAAEVLAQKGYGHLVRAVRAHYNRNGHRGPYNNAIVHCLRKLADVPEARLNKILALCGHNPDKDFVEAEVADNVVTRFVFARTAADKIYRDIQQRTAVSGKPVEGRFFFTEEFEAADGKKVSHSSEWEATFAPVDGEEAIKVEYTATGDTSHVPISDGEFAMCVFPEVRTSAPAPAQAGPARV
jgi:hypothetical protein